MRRKKLTLELSRQWNPKKAAKEKDAAFLAFWLTSSEKCAWNLTPGRGGRAVDSGEGKIARYQKVD